MPGEDQRDRREGSYAAEDGDLHAAAPAGFVASAQRSALAGLDHFREPQRLARAREGPPRTQALQRVEGEEMLAVVLAQGFDERELARLAPARFRGPGAGPAIES